MKPILNLTIKRHWFDMIVSGLKREEYRDANNRQVQIAFEKWHRLKNRPQVYSPVMILRNGYSMGNLAIAVVVKNIDLILVDVNRHPEWGEPTDSHFVITLGPVLHRLPYGMLRQFLKLGEAEG